MRAPDQPAHGIAANHRVIPALRDLLVALRPNQWTKNLVVLAALFFAFFDRSQSLQLGAGLARALPAAFLFCLVSSGIYLFNDLADLAADRAHPTKRYRPVAAGKIPLPIARLLAIGLLVFSLLASLVLSRPFAVVVVVYIGIQLIYSIGLKRLALVDVFVIASGFVLRAIAGALVLAVNISSWLLICTFMLALFLALCKRRHEKMFVDDLADEGRLSLQHYDKQLLDLLIAVTAATTIVCYAIYTLSAETITKFGTEALGLTLPFVMFGVFRYLDLVFRHDKGDRPEKILLTDLPILVNLGLYGVSLILIFLWAR